MGKKQPYPETRVSILSLRGKKDFPENELYYWYGGNPLQIEDPETAIVALCEEQQVYSTGPVERASERIVGAIRDTSERVGYVVAMQDLMVVNIPANDLTRLLFRIDQFFPGSKSTIRTIKDKKKKLAKTSDMLVRIEKVKAAEGDFATAHLPEVRLKIPDSRRYDFSFLGSLGIRPEEKQDQSDPS